MAIPLDEVVHILQRESDRVLAFSLAAPWGVPTEGVALGIDLPTGGRVSREIRVGVGPILAEDDVVAVPVWWEAAHHPHLFPTFDGGIELRGGDTGTEVRLVGSYQPPLGSVGWLTDGLIGHRLVIASLEAFLSELTDRLLRLTGDGCEQGSAHPPR